MILPRSSTVAVLFALAASLGCAASGCAPERGIREIGAAAEPLVALGPDRGPGGSRLTIDAGASLAISAGDEVGVFVQYARGGHWNVSTSCDTRASRQSCAFDLLISPEDGATFSGVAGQELSREDSLELRDDGTIRLVTATSYGLDGLTFDSTPGAAVEIDVRLDDASQPRFVHAVSSGGEVVGAPENPVTLLPSAP
jgi:hypothetical protein